ncbi:MAG: hypothetical protein Q9184_001465 [Pyrenodesmia sp. 2 TL-2023]
MPFCRGGKTVARKLVLLGDGACGKTSLLNVFTRGYFPTVYEPTVFENYVHGEHCTTGPRKLDLGVKRMAAQGHVDSKDSLENVESKWVSEIAENCQGVKLVLVALKCDLRTNTDDEDDGEEEDPSQPRKEKVVLTYKEGLEVARRIQACRYLECSAKRNRGVNEAFTEAARVALGVKTGTSSSSSKCIVM